MKKLAFSIGLIAALLGALWLLQGLGILQMEPILCFADCVPIQGSSTTWVIIGAVVLSAGGAVMYWSLKRRPGLAVLQMSYPLWLRHEDEAVAARHHPFRGHS